MYYFFYFRFHYDSYMAHSQYVKNNNLFFGLLFQEKNAEIEQSDSVLTEQTFIFYLRIRSKNI